MRKVNTFWKAAVGVISIIWAGGMIYTSLFGMLHPMVGGPISLCLGLVMIFILYPLRKTGLSRTHPSLLDGILMLLSIAACCYVVVHYKYFLFHPGERVSVDLIFAIVLIGVLIEGVRRSIGWVVPGFLLILLAYTILGGYVPGALGHRGFSIPWLFHQLYRTPVGFWGEVTTVVVAVVNIFMIFGPVLFATGAGDTLMNLANFLGSRLRGGPAQVSVVASSFFGSISGSAVANVTSTGTITIPTMKKAGFSKDFAGAVEAASSSGGQIMPPIMGSGAFVMAELLGIPYLEVMIAALIPALLFYFSITMGIFAQAGFMGLKKISPEQRPSARETFAWKSFGKAVIPLVVLVGLLLYQLPAQFACGCSILVTLAMFLLSTENFAWSSLMNRLRTLWTTVASACVTLCWLMAMIVCIQGVVCLVGFTGIGAKFTTSLTTIGAQNLALALVLAMVASMVLGMGLPTVAAYVVSASIMAPSLIELGVMPIGAHMFIFYFAILSAITPPVAVAAYPAAAISGGNWIKIAFIACSLGITAFIIPFSFVLDPTLLMFGNAVQIAGSICLAILGAAAFAFGRFGFSINHKIGWFVRLLFIAGGLCLLLAYGLSQMVGLALVAAAVLTDVLATIALKKLNSPT